MNLSARASTTVRHRAKSASTRAATSASSAGATRLVKRLSTSHGWHEAWPSSSAAGSLGKGMSHYLVERLETTPNIEIYLRSEVTLAEGEDHLERISIRSRASDAETQLVLDALFVLIGGEPHGDYAPGIRRDEKGFMLTGPALMNEPGFAERWPLERPPYFLETSMSGLLAAGDIRSGAVKRVASAVGEGAMAVQLVHQVLQHAGR